LTTPVTAARFPGWVHPAARREALRRRAVTVPALWLALVAFTAGLVVLVPGALVVDLVRRVASGRRPVALRLVAVGWAYLLAESAGLVALAAIWLTAGRPGPARARRLLERTYTVQRWWARSLFRAVTAAFGLRWSVVGAADVPPGPVIVLMRHASIVDTLVPSVFVAAPHTLRLRYVLKRELLRDPCLDVAGNRLPNCFVDRGGERSAHEVARVRALAEGLGPRDGVLIYPEGTRFSPRRRARVLERMRQEDPARAAWAARLRNVLPPRRGGTLALLEAAPDADVVVCAHHGLDGFAAVRDVWRGALVGRRIEVSFRRIPRERVPASRPECAAWLDETWCALDEWVAARVSPPGG
jgi:1-acyl-sn-glycerol-3-phosphate acyltransferase